MSLKLLKIPSVFLLSICVGCSRAPAIDLVGSFLPSWMLCLTFGVIVTGVTRWQLIRRRIEDCVMPVVVFYPSLLVASACLMWLVLFR